MLQVAVKEVRGLATKVCVPALVSPFRTLGQKTKTRLSSPRLALTVNGSSTVTLTVTLTPSRISLRTVSVDPGSQCSVASPHPAPSPTPGPLRGRRRCLLKRWETVVSIRPFWLPQRDFPRMTEAKGPHGPPCTVSAVPVPSH